MIKKFYQFFESDAYKPTVVEVEEFFHNTIEDFCDNQKQFFEFTIVCNNWNIKPMPESEIKWISFTITSETEFTTREIFPLIKRLFDWSKKSGADLKGLNYHANEGRIWMTRFKESGIWVSKVTQESITNPHTFERENKWQYHNIFSFK